MDKLKNIKIIPNELDWDIINPEDWDNLNLWKKVRDKDEHQRKEIDTQTNENFVYSKKPATFASKKETGEKPGVTIKKLYFDEPYHGQIQKKWYFDNSGSLIAKVINTYGADGRIINETWFNKDNKPDMESSHVYDKRGDFYTVKKNYGPKP